jgi:hypothetical protein
VQEIRTLVVNRLKADATLMDIVLGGVYDRPLRSGKTQGATPDAFYIKPGDAAGIVRVHESIVVLGPNEVASADGPTGVEDLRLYNGFLRVYYYVPVDEKIHLDQMDARVRWLLNPKPEWAGGSGWQPALSTGYPLSLEHLELTEALDGEEWLGTLVSYRRFGGEYLRPPV